jgi:hypothetical protein
MAIFSDLIKKVMEVFMVDFSVYGETFEDCLEYINKVLGQNDRPCPKLGEVSFHGLRRNCPWA